LEVAIDSSVPAIQIAPFELTICIGRKDKGTTGPSDGEDTELREHETMQIAQTMMENLK
jgi:hypothetical protein